MIAYGRKPKARLCGGVPGESSAPRLMTCPAKVTFRTAITTGDGTLGSHVGCEMAMPIIEIRLQRSRSGAIWLALCTKRAGAAITQSYKEREQDHGKSENQRRDCMNVGSEYL